MKRAAFYGPPGSGKSTLAHSMERYYGGQVISFAEALREEVSQAYDISPRDLIYVPQKYKHRKLLQEYGAEKRAQDPDYWVKAWLDKYHQHLGFGTRSFWVDDVRYDNEVDVLVDEGFVLVECLPNPSDENLAISGDEATHESEIDWKLWVPNVKMNWQRQKNGAAIRAAELIVRLNVGVKYGN